MDPTLYLPSTISITNLALLVEEPKTDDDVDGAVKEGTTSDDVKCGVDDGDGSECVEEGQWVVALYLIKVMVQVSMMVMVMVMVMSE